MLVLSRKKTQTILLHTKDGPVEITVLQTKGGTVKIGIDAPQSVRAVRGELEDFNEPNPNPENADPGVPNPFEPLRSV